MEFRTAFFLQAEDCDGKDRRSLEDALEEEASHGSKDKPTKDSKKAI